MKKLTNIVVASMLLAVSGSVLADGQKTYQATCQACHNSGAAGAPSWPLLSRARVPCRRRVPVQPVLMMT
jgi:hypothetical protein